MTRKLLFAFLFLLCLPSLLIAQPKVTITQVAGPVYLMQGDGGGNIAVIADPAGVILIDAMDERSANAIRAAIKVLPGGDKVRILVNTHWHGDHTDGNKAFGPASQIIAQENVRPLLMTTQTIMGEKTAALPAGALPSKTYKDKMTLSAGDAVVRLVYYPNAHTNGDTVVFIDKYKVVHMGDMFFNGMFPFIDAANGGNIDNWVRHLDAILAKLPADTKIIPGHGPLGSVDQLKSFRQMLFDTAAIVRKQKNEGKTIEQIKAAGLPESFNPWTHGYFTTPQYLELVYSSLEKK
jgi:cyclase